MIMFRSRSRLKAMHSSLNFLEKCLGKMSWKNVLEKCLVVNVSLDGNVVQLVLGLFGSPPLRQS